MGTVVPLHTPVAHRAASERLNLGAIVPDGSPAPASAPSFFSRLKGKLARLRDRLRWQPDEQDHDALMFLAGSLWGSFLTGGVTLALLHRLH